MVLVDESAFPGVLKRWVVKKRLGATALLGLGGCWRVEICDWGMVAMGLVGSVFWRFGVDCSGWLLLRVGM
jgi:hypothetical protein